MVILNHLEVAVAINIYCIITAVVEFKAWSIQSLKYLAIWQALLYPFLCPTVAVGFSQNSCFVVVNLVRKMKENLISELEVKVLWI